MGWLDLSPSAPWQPRHPLSLYKTAPLSKTPEEDELLLEELDDELLELLSGVPPLLLPLLPQAVSMKKSVMPQAMFTALLTELGVNRILKFKRIKANA